MTISIYSPFVSKGYLPNTSQLFHDSNVLIIVLKVVTVISVVYALIQDLFYNLECAIQYLKTERKYMNSFDPCDANVERIQNFLLEHTPELFSGSIVSRNRSRNSNIVHHGTKLGGVFSLKNLPDLIFKMDTVFNGKRRANHRRSLGMSVDRRYENILLAQNVCKESKFHYLKIPKSVKFEITPTNASSARLRKFRILAQEMFTPLSNGEENLKIRNANLSDQAIVELVEFILKTGFYDVDDRNFLVIEEDNVRKIAIIDYEYVDQDCLDLAFHGGSLNRNQKATIQGLFNILPTKTNLINTVLKRNNREDLI